MDQAVSGADYSDSSALVKRYVDEAGSAWFQARCNDVARTIATADLPPLIFVAADEELLRAAQSEGLETENPGLHP